MSGRDTCSSNPSRRIISIRIDSCSSPRPTTFICSGVSVGSRRIDTLPSSSLSSRSFSWRDVTYCPSRPATGDVLTPKIMYTVGSSIAIGGIAIWCSMSVIVSPIVMSSMPARQTMSPAAASWMSTRFRPSKAIELGDLGVLHGGIELHHRHGIADLDAAVEDAADGDAAEVVARVEVGDQQLQRRIGIAARRRHVLDDRVEQRPQILARPVRVERRGADPRVGVEHREVELILVGVEIDEQVVDLVQHFRGARVGPVDLVDDDDRRQPALERLAQHEPRLRQRPFRRVHQQHHAVHHRQRPLDLAAEVGVARRVDDVDQEVLVVNGGVLGQNRDAALALELVAVHRALGDALVRPERAALVQQRIHQRGLAVIDVGDDGDVAAQRVGDVRRGSWWARQLLLTDVRASPQYTGLADCEAA